MPVPSPPEFPLENEPVLSYKKGSREREELEKVLGDMASECEEVPLVIGNEEIKTDLCKYQVMVRDSLIGTNLNFFFFPLIERGIFVAAQS